MDDFSLNQDHLKVTQKTKNGSGLRLWLIRKKIVNNEYQAKLVLLSFVVVSILLVAYLNWPTKTLVDIEEKYYQDVILDE